MDKIALNNVKPATAGFSLAFKMSSRLPHYDIGSFVGFDKEPRFDGDDGRSAATGDLDRLTLGDSGASNVRVSGGRALTRARLRPWPQIRYGNGWEAG